VQPLFHAVNAVHHDQNLSHASMAFGCCAGNYCQDVKLQKGAQYKLSYYYGRLMNFQQG
jgi:hypothetical protein